MSGLAKELRGFSKSVHTLALKDGADGLAPLIDCLERAAAFIEAIPSPDSDAAHNAGIEALEKVSAWAIANGFATGHADTLNELLSELEGQVTALRWNAAP
jgi:hypothetical protein